jgi:hypothetical protein
MRASLGLLKTGRSPIMLNKRDSVGKLVEVKAE